MIAILDAHADVVVQRATQLQPLPPASLQTFLHKVNMSGLVLADHKATYTNK